MGLTNLNVPLVKQSIVTENEDSLSVPSIGRTSQRYFTMRQLVEYFPKTDGVYLPGLCSLILCEHHLPAMFVSQDGHSAEYTLLGEYAHNFVFTARECMVNGDKFLKRKIGKYTMWAIVIEPNKQSENMIALYKGVGVI